MIAPRYDKTPAKLRIVKRDFENLRSPWSALPADVTLAERLAGGWDGEGAVLDLSALDPSEAAELADLLERPAAWNRRAGLGQREAELLARTPRCDVVPVIDLDPHDLDHVEDPWGTWCVTLERTRELDEALRTLGIRAGWANSGNKSTHGHLRLPSGWGHPEAHRIVGWALGQICASVGIPRYHDGLQRKADRPRGVPLFDDSVFKGAGGRQHTWRAPGYVREDGRRACAIDLDTGAAWIDGRGVGAGVIPVEVLDGWVAEWGALQVEYAARRAERAKRTPAESRRRARAERPLPTGSVRELAEVLRRADPGSGRRHRARQAWAAVLLERGLSVADVTAALGAAWGDWEDAGKAAATTDQRLQAGMSVIGLHAATQETGTQALLGVEEVLAGGGVVGAIESLPRWSPSRDPVRVAAERLLAGGLAGELEGVAPILRRLRGCGVFARLSTCRDHGESEGVYVCEHLACSSCFPSKAKVMRELAVRGWRDRIMAGHMATGGAVIPRLHAAEAGPLEGWTEEEARHFVTRWRATARQVGKRNEGAFACVARFAVGPGRYRIRLVTSHVRGFGFLANDFAGVGCGQVLIRERVTVEQGVDWILGALMRTHAELRDAIQRGRDEDLRFVLAAKGRRWVGRGKHALPWPTREDLRGELKARAQDRRAELAVETGEAVGDPCDGECYLTERAHHRIYHTRSGVTVHEVTGYPPAYDAVLGAAAAVQHDGLDVVRRWEREGSFVAPEAVAAAIRPG